MKPALTSNVSTLDAILHAAYEILSGPAGQPRDWERYRTLATGSSALEGTGLEQFCRCYIPSRCIRSGAEQA